MRKPVVSCGPVHSRIILVGQAPGDKEPILGRPFAWTAGKTLFRWFGESCHLTEAQFRKGVYMAAVCRCFPGKKPTGGDRVPDDDEVANCSRWLKAECDILKPELILGVGRLAIDQFMPGMKLDQLIGRQFRITYEGRALDFIPLPHPSGASPWHRMEPGKTLLRKALRLCSRHRSMRKLIQSVRS